MAVDLAVVIVTWNVRDLIVDALDSLFADLQTSGLSAQVYLVDSASSDDTVALVAARYPQVTLIASTENIGFGRSNNLALRQIGFGQPDAPDLPKAVYLLNPDTITHAGATLSLYNALMADSNVGLVGASLCYEDGSFQHGAFMFPGLRQLWAEFFPLPGRLYESAFNGRYSQALYAGDQPFPIDFPLGATMMLRAEVIQQTGMFDEAFFMYCEEVDWAWRIHRAGWAVQCVPASVVTHLSGKSAGQVRPRSLMNLWTSRLHLYGKYYPAWKLAIARRMVAFGMGQRAAQTDDPELKSAYEHIRLVALGKSV